MHRQILYNISPHPADVDMQATVQPAVPRPSGNDGTLVEASHAPPYNVQASQENSSDMVGWTIIDSIDDTSEQHPRQWGNDTDNNGGVQITPRIAASQVKTPSPVSWPTTSLSQHDREQLALYQQRYTTSPSASSPEAQSLIQESSESLRQGVVMLGGITMSLSPASDVCPPRPGSLLAGGNHSGDESSSVPELSIIRVFSGKNLQTEETYKTVLLNSSTTSEALVKQAVLRFRLPTGGDVADYYLTVKRVEGSSAELRPEEKPLVVFETLTEAALDLLKIERNDFADDTPVKIYLNRRSETTSDESAITKGDITTNTEHPVSGFRDAERLEDIRRIPNVPHTLSSYAPSPQGSPGYFPPPSPPVPADVRWMPRFWRFLDRLRFASPLSPPSPAATSGESDAH